MLNETFSVIFKHRELFESLIFDLSIFDLFRLFSIHLAKKNCNWTPRVLLPVSIIEWLLRYKSRPQKVKNAKQALSTLVCYACCICACYFLLWLLMDRLALEATVSLRFMTLLSFSSNIIFASASCHGVWKSQKKSHSTLRAKRATYTFWVDKS